MRVSQKITYCLMFCGLVATMVPSIAKAATEEDKTFLATAAQSDVNEIKLSQLAEEKATTPAVKSFAQQMVTDHTQMTASMKPFADSWGLTPPASPDAEHQQAYEKLNGLSGADFDKAYMSLMAADHAKALDLFTSEAKSTKDAQFRAAVTKGKTIIAGHKKMADKLVKKT
jgi:putative membrane protein